MRSTDPLLENRLTEGPRNTPVVVPERLLPLSRRVSHGDILCVYYVLQSVPVQ